MVPNLLVQLPSQFTLFGEELMHNNKRVFEPRDVIDFLSKVYVVGSVSVSIFNKISICITLVLLEDSLRHYIDIILQQ